MKRNYYNWVEEDAGLDVPLISPENIPPDCIQHWDTESQTFMLIKRMWGKPTKPPHSSDTLSS